MTRAAAFAPRLVTDLIDLANNENPLGPSPAAIEAIQREAAQVHRYPDHGGLPLRQTLAAKYQLSPEQIMLGNGSNELIDLIARQWARPGAEVIIPSPAFLPYGSTASRAGARVIRTGLSNWQFDLKAALAMISEKTSLIILANPNNPTGLQLDREEIAEWLSDIPEQILVVLDAAYAEYSSDPEQSLKLLRQRENLLVLRTFSKAYGLAGLRIGYALGHPAVITQLASQRQQFHVNRLAQAAALAALMDQEHLRRGVQGTLKGRQKLCSGLRDLGIAHLPSETNFILLHCGRSNVTAETLLAHGLLVKPLDRFGLDEFIRVTIGSPEAIERLLNALKELQQQPWFPLAENSANVPPQPCSGE